jgi:RNA polymerase sigma-70 factor (ECF subfamily)
MSSPARGAPPDGLVAASLAPATEPPRADALPLDLDAVYREHAPTVMRWTARLAGPDLDVEDIVHEVFLVAQKRRDTFHGASKVSTWLYGITVRVLSDRRRARRWRRWFGLGSRRLPVESADELPGVEPTPLERLEGAQAARIVYEILDRLGEAHRTVLVLFELEGLSGREIAEVTGTTEANVWIRLHRARKQFLARFSAWEESRNGETAR